MKCLRCNKDIENLVREPWGISYTKFGDFTRTDTISCEECGFTTELVNYMPEDDIEFK
jgi:DNA-directed RNA polymerase subunit RPC12/RpoP